MVLPPSPYQHFDPPPPPVTLFPELFPGRGSRIYITPLCTAHTTHYAVRDLWGVQRHDVKIVMVYETGFLSSGGIFCIKHVLMCSVSAFLGDRRSAASILLENDSNPDPTLHSQGSGLRLLYGIITCDMSHVLVVCTLQTHT